MQILIVEDELRLAQALNQIMLEAGYLTDVVYNGKDGLDYGLRGIYDVIILDIMLPGMDGFRIVESLRAQRVSTPVLMLTARDDVRDKVNALDCGADDYMTKPFIPEELLARIRALSRRQGEILKEEMCFSDLTLNLSSCELSCGKRSIHLGNKEFEILKLMMSNPRIICSKETFIRKVWGSSSGAEDNNVEAYISFLRKKLAYLNSGVSIVAVRKVGYHLREDNQE